MDCFVREQCKKYKKNQSCDNDEFCIKEFKLSELYRLTLLPENQWKRLTLLLDEDLSDRDAFMHLKDVENNILDFVNSGKNLFIFSENVGNGKTSWAVRMLQAYINNIWIDSSIRSRALFINVPRFLLSLKDSISKDNDYVSFIKDNVLNVDLVIWDEIGVKSLTSFEHDHILNLINTRIENKKSNIYTSNMFGKELNENLGDRLYSRINNLSIPVQLFGKDKRGLIV